ncbi:AAA family ATPase [Yersinia proxima]|uniref:AAA family ATPase n=1 Tax=Yersinia proxima TaxID=2890316 RepID=UPI001D11983A|nr:DUF3696 domain-containing protein [Yersinia proxima]
MFDKIELHNFKSARQLSIQLSPLTVLTGLNGSGKSSILQALALLKQSLKQDKTNQNLILRGELIKLGKSEDVRFENADDDTISLTLLMDSGTVKFSAIALPDADTLSLTTEGDVGSIIDAFSNGFQFIQADRITPATQYDQASTPEQIEGWLGCNGQYTIDYLLRNGTNKISTSRLFPKEHPSLSSEFLAQIAPTESLLDQTTGWLQLLSPGVRPRAVALELADATSLRFSYTGSSVDSTSREHRPSNVGFGLTYSLPIIVACLSAKKNSLLLLENPEAHLHPRGQFALGTLLACCAADDVQIIVETHSDHLLNGIRVATKNNLINNENVSVHFFSRDIEGGETSIISPVLYSNGRFSEWPEGFFDEWSKALDELLDI